MRTRQDIAHIERVANGWIVTRYEVNGWGAREQRCFPEWDEVEKYMRKCAFPFVDKTEPAGPHDA